LRHVAGGSAVSVTRFIDIVHEAGAWHDSRVALPSQGRPILAPGDISILRRHFCAA
jgi:hypothetical protein